MHHVLRYEGSYERNFPTARPGSNTYVADDGGARTAEKWPDDADGLRFGFMEKRGKRFLAVRIGNKDTDVVLQHPISLEPDRHLGGKRFSAAPIPVGDGPASALVTDMLDANASQRDQITALRDWVRRERVLPGAS